MALKKVRVVETIKTHWDKVAGSYPVPKELKDIAVPLHPLTFTKSFFSNTLRLTFDCYRRKRKTVYQRFAETYVDGTTPLTELPTVSGLGPTTPLSVPLPTLRPSSDSTTLRRLKKSVRHGLVFTGDSRQEGFVSGGKRSWQRYTTLILDPRHVPKRGDLTRVYCFICQILIYMVILVFFRRIHF